MTKKGERKTHIHPEITKCGKSVDGLMVYLAKQDPANKDLLLLYAKKNVYTQMKTFKTRDEMLKVMCKRASDVGGLLKLWETIHEEEKKTYEHMFPDQENYTNEFLKPVKGEDFCILLSRSIGYGKDTICHK